MIRGYAQEKNVRGAIDESRVLMHNSFTMIHNVWTRARTACAQGEMLVMTANGEGLVTRAREAGVSA